MMIQSEIYITYDLFSLNSLMKVLSGNDELPENPIFNKQLFTRNTRKYDSN